MTGPAEVLEPYGSLLLFAAIFADQIGLPMVAGLPVLLAAGALAAAGKASLLGAVGLAVAASVLADLVWYRLGRRRGRRILALVCRLSLEPDACVRRTEDAFVRHGLWSLPAAKFIPAMGTVAPALAGAFGTGLRRFLPYDALAGLLWAGSYTSLGYLLSDQLEAAAALAARTGGALVAVLVVASGGYGLYRYVRRRRFLNGLRAERITAEELRRRLDAGEEVVILDLRHRLDVEADPCVIPGARVVAPEELERPDREIPLDRDVVVYCS